MEPERVAGVDRQCMLRGAHVVQKAVADDAPSRFGHGVCHLVEKGIVGVQNLVDVCKDGSYISAGHNLGKGARGLRYLP